MLEMNDKNNAAKMLKGDCKIHVQESEKLLEPVKSWNSQIYIEFNDLCYSVCCNLKGKLIFYISIKWTEKMILHNVTGHFEPRKVTVIVGPSGSGKTTLLKIISGKQQVDITGTITVNGAEPNKKIFHKQVCYVPQQFDLLPYLTTRETLYIAARLKLNVNQNKQAICLMVNNIAERFNLSKCLDTLANKLSGGERKRLSIGVEMFVQPSVFLLDEPTSGLDSTDSNQLINILHDMARANCTVICIIHQPSSQMISLFDNIIVLNQGKCMYCGPKDEILNTYSIAGFTCPNFYNIIEFVFRKKCVLFKNLFSHIYTANFIPEIFLRTFSKLLEVVTKQRGGDVENLYKICCDEYVKFRLRNKHEKGLKETCTNRNRSITSDSRFCTIRVNFEIISSGNPQLSSRFRIITLTKLRFVAHILVALLLGTVFYNFGDDAEKVSSNIAYLFFCLLFLFFTNSILAVQMFPIEATVFLQEHLNNWYSLRSYYSVKIISDLLMQILCASSLVLISYYVTGQPMEYDRILRMWGICLLITILGQTIGVLAGIIFGTEIGMFLIPAIGIPLILFAGFFSKLEEIYAFEGVMQAIYLDRPNLTCLEIYCYLRSPNKILTMMGIPTVPFYVTLIILAFWILLEVITEQRGGDLENLYKICRDECENFKLRTFSLSKKSYMNQARIYNTYSYINYISISCIQAGCSTSGLYAANLCACPEIVLELLRPIMTTRSTTYQIFRQFDRNSISIRFVRGPFSITVKITLNNFYNNVLTKVRFMTHIGVALLLGIVFYNFGDDAEKVNSNIACLFFFVLFLFFMNAERTIQTFPIEAEVFLKEHLNNWYSLRAYYSVKIITDLVMQILCTSAFVFISYYMTGQPMEYDRILKTWSICLLTMMLGQTIGIIAGTAFGCELGMFLISSIHMPLLLFAGFFTKIGEMSPYLQPLSVISYFRYAFEGIMQAVYLGRPNLKCSEIYCHFRSPSKILSMADMPTIPFYAIPIILGSWILCLHALHYVILHWKIYYAKK
ncbi:ATP-binding cassette sub-family G member 4 [Trachymyrmex cornetzi]|uniref:ATP-binding cassette sub-family G member 4 n=1 Tax=Trachymyrmex cornetzi TaxID=471704 RepID=A0A151J8U4_9HYME|nr:ATP-binding cassette sub-family G member 4 [Trachymyrmex cornetzi]